MFFTIYCKYLLGIKEYPLLNQPPKTHKMRFSLLLCLLLAGTLNLFTSCEKEEVQPNLNESTQPAHLVFTSSKDLRATLSVPIRELTRPNIHPNSNTPFVSYRDAFKDTEKELAGRNDANTLPSSLEEIESQFNVNVVADEDEGYSFEPIVRMPRLSNLLNEYRVLQIGDDVIQYDRTEKISVPYSDVVDFKNLRTSPGAKIEQRDDVVTIQKAERLIEGICTDNYRYDGKDHRLKPRWYSQEYKEGSVGVVEIWVEIKHQKKGAFGAWYANEEDEIRAVGTIRHYANINEPVVVVPTNIVHFNTSDLTFDIHGGGTGSQDPTYWILSNSSLYHSSKDGGASANCTISK